MKALSALACLLAACAGVPLSEATPPDPAGEEAPAASPAPLEPTRDWDAKSVLYARDGTPIPATGPGAVTQSPSGQGGSTPNHRLAGDETGGRMYILELYQKVIEERDALTGEITALSAELDHTRRTLVEADRRIAALESAFAELEREKQGLIDENVELAARLTTAQIRRLQTEKILLEKELDDLRQAEAAVPEVAESKQP